MPQRAGVEMGQNSNSSLIQSCMKSTFRYSKYTSWIPWATTWIKSVSRAFSKVAEIIWWSASCLTNDKRYQIHRSVVQEQFLPVTWLCTGKPKSSTFSFQSSQASLSMGQGILRKDQLSTSKATHFHFKICVVGILSASEPQLATVFMAFIFFQLLWCLYDSR